MTTTHEASPPPLPEDLYGHLRSLSPRSYEFNKDLGALNELAQETGHAMLTLEHVFPPVNLVPPQGFVSETVIPSGAEVKIKPLEKTIHSLAVGDEVVPLDVHQLVTDSNRPINYCDLRPLMSAQVRDQKPKSEAQAEALDRAFLRDVKFFAETGHAKNSVTGVAGVNYTKLGNTKVRTYWMPVPVEQSEGVTTIGRIADCANSIAAEGSLYRRVFGKEL